MTAISNAGSLIWLAKYNRLHFLRNLYQKIEMPEAVYREAVAVGLEKGYRDAQTIQNAIKEGWIKVRKVKAVDPVRKVEEKLRVELGEGERETIALTLETEVKTFLTNDENAYIIGKNLNLKPRGILYVLLRKVKEKSISKKEAEELIKRMLQDGFWLTPTIIQKFYEALEKLGSKSLREK
jgi:predicted nucleic acid-binding protein